MASWFRRSRPRAEAPTLTPRDTAAAALRVDLGELAPAPDVFLGHCAALHLTFIEQLTVAMANASRVADKDALARAVGTSLSTAVVGMVLAWSIRRSELPASTTIPSTTGYVLAGLISLGACGLAVAMALAIPRRPRTSNFG